MGNQITGDQLITAFYKPIPSYTAAIALNSTGLTNVVNVSEEGVLSAVGIYVATSPGGSITATLEIQVDGQATESIGLLTASSAFQPPIRGWSSYINTSSGTQAFMIPFGLAYQSSLRVAINVTAAGSAGTLDVNVMRGRRS